MQTIHLCKTVKVGSGLSLNIPAEYLKALDIRRGDFLVVALYSGDAFVARKPTDQELLQLKPKSIQHGN